jgi:hypothetical protein
MKVSRALRSVMLLDLAKVKAERSATAIQSVPENEGENQRRDVKKND